MSSLWNYFKQGVDKRIQSCKIAILIYVCLNVVFLIMPYQVCQYMDEHMNVLVLLLNMIFVVSVFIFFIYPTAIIVSEYKKKDYKLYLVDRACFFTRMISKVFINVLCTSALYANVKIGEYIMSKFANHGHSYFELTLSYPFYEILFEVAVFIPVLYLFLYLLRYERYHEFNGFLTLITTFILYGIFSSLRVNPVMMVVVKSILCTLMIWRIVHIEMRVPELFE